MRPVLYLYNEAGTPFPLKSENRHDVLKWGDFMENSGNKIVKRSRRGHLLVSTVFLGVDYAFQGPPVVWETMVFDEDKDRWEEIAIDRCSGNREQAEAMHEAMCKKHEVPV